MTLSYATIERLLLVLIVAVSTAFVFRSGDALPFADERLYWGLAQGLSTGEGYVFNGRASTDRPPGYPLVIAATQLISDRPILAKLVNVAMLAVTVVLVCKLARRLSGSEAAGPLAAAIILGFPIVHYTCGTLYPQIFGGMLFVLIVWLTLRHPGRPPVGAACGLLFGLLLLAVPAFLLIVPVLLAYMAWPQGGLSDRDGLRRGVLSAALFVGATALVLSPWIARNALTFGKFIPLSTNSGLMMIQGNSVDARPNSGPSTDISRYTQEAIELGYDPIETDAHYRRRAVEWIREDPARAARLYVLKLINYFNYWNELATPSEASRLKQVVSFATYYPLLALAVVRLLMARRYPIGREEGLLLALYLFNAVVGAIFYHRLRYRLPFDYLLIALVAAHLARLLPTLWKGASPQPQTPPAAGGA